MASPRPDPVPIRFVEKVQVVFLEQHFLRFRQHAIARQHERRFVPRPGAGLKALDDQLDVVLKVRLFRRHVGDVDRRHVAHGDQAPL